MNKKAKGLLVAGVILLGLFAFACVAFAWYAKHARRAWKEAALPEIRRLADDPKWVEQEITLLSAPNSPKRRIIAESWLSDHMILMKNGEWLVYKSHCSKVPPHLVRDIFLAKASNGKWYYSTCHFCVGMCALVMMQEAPPLDLTTFVRRYHLKEFNGVSDECLQRTQTFPDSIQVPARTYIADIKPGPPDLAPLLHAAATAIGVATNSDPALKDHQLALCAIRYSHRFVESGNRIGIAFEAIYSDNKLQGGDATGIHMEVRDHVAYFKSQKGQPLVSYPLEGEPRVPEDALKTIAIAAITNFLPQIDPNRLSLDEIVCCDPPNGNRYSVKFRLADPFVGQSSTATYTRIELDVSPNGTVAEKDINWTSR